MTNQVKLAAAAYFWLRAPRGGWLMERKAEGCIGRLPRGSISGALVAIAVRRPLKAAPASVAARRA